MPDTTQEELKLLYSYDEQTGEFRCNKTNRVVGSVYPDGYRYMYVNTKRSKAHRLAFLYVTGSFPKGQVDHKDRVRDNNSWSNLRDVSHTINMRNRSNTKLSDNLVLEIRKRYKPRCVRNGARALSREFNLHYDTVEKIIRRELWLI